MHHYLIPLTCGPLLIVRLPSKGKPGRRQVAPKWRAVLRALTPVLQSHGMKRKDLSSIDNLSHPDEWDPAADVFMRSERSRAAAQQTAEIAQQAFEGGHGLADFWLYDWHEPTASFVLVRQPVSRVTVTPAVTVTPEHPPVTPRNTG